LCVALLALSGIVIWRAYFSALFAIDLIRLASVVHAAAAALMIGLIIVHVYAAIWTRGTIRAMLYGTVSRAWAKQHHPAWFRQMTGGGK
jgi:formate dehydrogenase subunit gamma